MIQIRNITGHDLDLPHFGFSGRVVKAGDTLDIPDEDFLDDGHSCGDGPDDVDVCHGPDARVWPATQWQVVSGTPIVPVPPVQPTPEPAPEVVPDPQPAGDAPAEQ